MKRSQFFWIIVALFASSFEPIIAKKSFAVLSPGELLWSKYLAAAFFMMIFSGGPRWLGIKTHIKLFPCAILLSSTFLFAMLSLTRLSAATFITFTTTTPAFVGIFNQIRGTEQLDRRFWIGFFLALIGVFASLHIGHENPFEWDFVGLLYAMGTIFSSTIYRTQLDLHTEVLPSKDVSYVIFSSNALIAISFTPFVNIPHTLSYWPTGVWLGAMACFANLGFVKMISYLGSTTSSMINLLQRPLIIILASIILNEPFTPLQFFFMTMVFYGVYLATTRKKKPERQPILVPRNYTTESVQSGTLRIRGTELGEDVVPREDELVSRKKSA